MFPYEFWDFKSTFLTEQLRVTTSIILVCISSLIKIWFNGSPNDKFHISRYIEETWSQKVAHCMAYLGASLEIYRLIMINVLN